MLPCCGLWWHAGGCGGGCDHATLLALVCACESHWLCAWLRLDHRPSRLPPPLAGRHPGRGKSAGRLSNMSHMRVPKYC
jgi:hypothetical protein